jgi:hypothetical protein
LKLKSVLKLFSHLSGLHLFRRRRRRRSHREESERLIEIQDTLMLCKSKPSHGMSDSALRYTRDLELRGADERLVVRLPAASLRSQ